MMQERVASSRIGWFTAAIGTTVTIAIVAAIVGFVWLPSLQTDAELHGIWDTICSAAGLIQNRAAHAPVVQADYPTTRVELAPQMLEGASAESIGRGATLALRCTMCHGARGLSEANSPNLAGEFPETIYKELMDFKTGARVSAVMAVMVPSLSDQDMRDLAAYYAYLPRPSDAAVGEPPPIVESGAPLRGIAPCGACHGEIGHKTGAAWLEGEPEPYLRAQLDDFASGARHNDIDGQMRNIVRRMTPQEIEAASRFYGGRS